VRAALSVDQVQDLEHWWRYRHPRAHCFSHVIMHWIMSVWVAPDQTAATLSDSIICLDKMICR
jgi:hypothetical protein